jgi:hypothetical protein
MNTRENVQMGNKCVRTGNKTKAFAFRYSGEFVQA